jgi:hypothetical protein
LNGFIQIPRVEQVEARELLLRFRKRSVGQQNFSVPDPHRCRSGNRLKSLGRDKHAALSESIAARHALLIGHGAQFFFFEVHET